MKTIYDKGKTRELLLQYGLQDYFENPDEIEMKVIEYKPKEYIQSPIDDRNLFQFVVEGELSIYYVRDEGMVYSLAHGSGRYVIGDIDLFCHSEESIYAEALSKVTCIAISLDQYKEVLLSDLAFVRMIAEGLARKLELLTRMEAEPNSLEERVINYLKYRCVDHSFKGLEKVAFGLHCSPRQLQRVMNGLTEKKQVCRIGKGEYRLLL